LNTLFNVRSEEEASPSTFLALEVGTNHCAYALLDEERRSVQQLTYISFEEYDLEKTLQQVTASGFPSSLKAAVVSSAFPDALLIPQGLSTEPASLLRHIYDQPAQHYVTDAIPEWQMNNQYALPLHVHQALHQLPSVTYCHAYTAALKVYNGFPAHSQVCLHLDTQHVRVLVRREGTVQLAQIYYYKTPLDVVYYLLKLFSAFSLDQKETIIVLSGLIEEDSAMYRELYSYFENLDFARPPALPLPHNDYPVHYFASLYNLVACVS